MKDYNNIKKSNGLFLNDMPSMLSSISLIDPS